MSNRQRRLSPLRSDKARARTSIQIELFFKALKRNLKITTFIGISPNALHVQVWTALITILLRFLQLRSRFAWLPSNLVALLRMNLFVHRELWS